MIKLIDDQIGRITAALDAMDLRRNTVIIFMSDHGETLGDHGLIMKGCRFYEGLVRVPLIWSWPERFLCDICSCALVELTDIVPTLLSLVGQIVPEYMVGQSLLPILTGERTQERHRDYVRCGVPRCAQICPIIRGRPCIRRPLQGRPLSQSWHWRTLRFGGRPGEFDNLWDHEALVICAQLWCGVPLTQHYQHCTPAPNRRGPM